MLDLGKSFILDVLREAYSKTNIQLADNYVYELYDKKDETELEEKYNIGIYPYLGSPNENKMIQEARYTKDKIIICLDYDSIDKIDKGEGKNQLITELRRVLIHEDTHKQQNKNDSMKKVKYYNPNDKGVSTEMYLSQYFEIDAFARETAFYFQEKGYDIKSTIKAIETNEYEKIIDNQELKDTIWHFKNNVSHGVFIKFLKEIWRFYRES